MRTRRVLFGFSGSWVLAAARILNGLAVMPLYYRFLDQATLGSWILFASLGGFLLFADLGLAMVFSRAMAWHQGARDGDKRDDQLVDAVAGAGPQDLLKTVGLAYGLLGLAVLALGAVAGWIYLGSLNLEAAALLEVRQAWLIYAVGVALVLAASTPNYALQGLGDVGVESFTQALAFGLAFVATVAVLFQGGGVRALALVFLGQQAAVRLALALLLRRRHRWLFEKKGRFHPAALKAMLAQTMPLFVTRMGALLVFQINPVLIVAAMGAAALPDYNALFLLAMYGHQIFMVLPQTLMPFVAEKRAAGDQEGIRRLLFLCVKAAMALQLLYAAVMLFWAPQWVDLWLGQGHYLGTLILATLLFCYLAETHHAIHASFTFSGGAWPYARWALAASVINVVLVWSGLKVWGLAGAAAGTMLAQLVTNNWFVPFDTLRRLGVPLADYGRRAALPLLGHALWLGAAGWALSRGLPRLQWPLPSLRGVDGNVWASAVAGAVLLALLALPSAWILLDGSERGYLRERLSRR